tara:strand:- start:521 stop:985 length:465 start_codon:yes stop_codon:yes gene_type:complete
MTHQVDLAVGYSKVNPLQRLPTYDATHPPKGYDEDCRMFMCEGIYPVDRDTKSGRRLWEEGCKLVRVVGQTHHFITFEKVWQVELKPDTNTVYAFGDTFRVKIYGRGGGIEWVGGNSLSKAFTTCRRLLNWDKPTGLISWSVRPNPSQDFPFGE